MNYRVTFYSSRLTVFINSFKSVELKSKLVSSAYNSNFEIFDENIISWINKINKSGPMMLPCATTLFIFISADLESPSTSKFFLFLK